MRQRPPSSTLFPYTTLFRSAVDLTLLCKQRGQPLSFNNRRVRIVVDPIQVRLSLLEITLRLQQSRQFHGDFGRGGLQICRRDRKSTRLNSSHSQISYAVFCLNATASTELYTLSLHDALPICGRPHPAVQAARPTAVVQQPSRPDCRRPDPGTS